MKEKYESIKRFGKSKGIKRFIRFEKKRTGGADACRR